MANILKDQLDTLLEEKTSDVFAREKTLIKNNYHQYINKEYVYKYQNSVANFSTSFTTNITFTKELWFDPYMIFVSIISCSSDYVMLKSGQVYYNYLEGIVDDLYIGLDRANGFARTKNIGSVKSFNKLDSNKFNTPSELNIFNTIRLSAKNITKTGFTLENKVTYYKKDYYAYAVAEIPYLYKVNEIYIIGV